MTSDHEAVDQSGWLVGVQRNAAGAFEKHREHDPCLDSGEGGTDAVVDVTFERHVAPRSADKDLIGAFEHRWIPVGGALEQQDRWSYGCPHPARWPHSLAGRPARLQARCFG